MPLAEEIMHTRFHDKAGEDKTLDYTSSYYKREQFKEIINDLCRIFVDFETITSESKHMPYLCWIVNDGIQHECIGINICAADMLNA